MLQSFQRNARLLKGHLDHRAQPRQIRLDRRELPSCRPEPPNSAPKPLFQLTEIHRGRL